MILYSIARARVPQKNLLCKHTRLISSEERRHQPPAIKRADQVKPVTLCPSTRNDDDDYTTRWMEPPPPPPSATVKKFGTKCWPHSSVRARLCPSSFVRTSGRWRKSPQCDKQLRQILTDQNTFCIISRKGDDGIIERLCQYFRNLIINILIYILLFPIFCVVSMRAQ